MKGMGTQAKVKNAISVVAHWTPNAVYISVAKRGKAKPKHDLINVLAASADAAQR